ncbi:uncharacterized protein [Dermacentor albipictus]|uniref:uncharacterized protein n=1 Tax=Dermacentor albipictus TaxID=60249 RepID=UPI0031FC23B4
MAYGRRTPIAQNSRAQALRCWTTRNLQCGHCCHLPVMAGDVTHPKHGVNSVFSRRDIEIFERWFRCGDPKETGDLDVEGLKRLWTSLQMDVTQMSAKWLIALADDNRNGKLNFGEFLYLWMMAAENSEFQSTPEGQAMLRTMQAFEIYPVASEKKQSSCYTLNPWVRSRFLDQGDEGRPLDVKLPQSRIQEARELCQGAAKQRAAFIAQAKSLYEGSTRMQHKVHAERRAEFIKWARTTFEDDKVVQKNVAGEIEHEEQVTYHDASVCPVMSKSSPAISEFSLDQCSFLADWFHRWDMNKDGLLDGHEIGNMFHCLRIPISPSALQAIVQYFDEDMDGKLNFREFLLMWRAAIYDPDFQRTAEGCKMVKHMRIHNLLPNQARKPSW